MKRAHIYASILIIAVVFLLPFVYGCMGFLRDQFGDGSGLVFTHKTHNKYVSECVSCHEIDKGEITKASHKTCVQCHSINEAMPGDEKCQLCHSRKDGRIVQIRPSERSNYGLAPPQHAIHDKAKISCRECHGEVEKTSRSSAIDFIKMEGCVACHFKGKAVEDLNGQCLLCHNSMGKDHKPTSHESPAWKGNLHGKSSQTESFMCSRCHNQSSCDQCHKVMSPKDHTSVFKLRGHGMIAVSDPTRCEACHRQDFCIRCHTTVQPKYHTRAFKSARPYTHCGMCHFPLEEGNRCQTCHFVLKHTQAIATAPPPPPFVNRSLPCFTCHPVNLVPIRHLYNTIPDTQCILCHK